MCFKKLPASCGTGVIKYLLNKGILPYSGNCYTIMGISYIIHTFVFNRPGTVNQTGLFVPAFYHGLDHLKPPVWLYKIWRMSGYYYGLTGQQDI